MPPFLGLQWKQVTPVAELNALPRDYYLSRSRLRDSMPYHHRSPRLRLTLIGEEGEGDGQAEEAEE